MSHFSLRLTTALAWSVTLSLYVQNAHATDPGSMLIYQGGWSSGTTLQPHFYDNGIASDCDVATSSVPQTRQQEHAEYVACVFSKYDVVIISPVGEIVSTPNSNCSDGEEAQPGIQLCEWVNQSNCYVNYWEDLDLALNTLKRFHPDTEVYGYVSASADMPDRQFGRFEAVQSSCQLPHLLYESDVAKTIDCPNGTCSNFIQWANYWDRLEDRVQTDYANVVATSGWEPGETVDPTMGSRTVIDGIFIDYMHPETISDNTRDNVISYAASQTNGLGKKVMLNSLTPYGLGNRCGSQFCQFDWILDSPNLPVDTTIFIEGYHASVGSDHVPMPYDQAQHTALNNKLSQVRLDGTSEGLSIRFAAQAQAPGIQISKTREIACSGWTDPSPGSSLATYPQAAYDSLALISVQGDIFQYTDATLGTSSYYDDVLDETVDNNAITYCEYD